MKTYVLRREEAVRGLFADYVVLAKPGIVALVLVSTLAGIYLGGRGSAPVSVMLWTLLGVGLATAGSAVLNNYVDRDIDRLMERTSSRALAMGTIDPATALAVGLVLTAASVYVLVAGTNLLTAALTGAASFIYVVVYAMALKRRTHHANQIGGIAGALPPVIGYAAATGELGTEAAALFAIVALWQQPHALSLALKYRDDYASAGVPAVPVVKGVGATKLLIALYTIALMPASMLPWYLGLSGRIYLASALVSGVIFAALALRFLRSRRSSSMPLFFYSIIYLTALFTAMVVDMAD